MDITVQDPLVGQVLDGRYRVEERIAVGGMATVYRAVDLRLDRTLALKVMHPGLAADEGFVERFIREAKAVARLAHPNVVNVYDQGTDGTYVYLAMEYVAGRTLRGLLRERGALSPRAALDVLEPVLAALGAAHRAGLIHRDMKPENVLLGDGDPDATGRSAAKDGPSPVKVADFGLVRAVDTQTGATTGAVLGTVSYLAPEQIEHGIADQRSDVYACGVVLYEMLTGRKPHPGNTPMQVIMRHLNEDVPAPSAAVPTIVPALDALVALATARDPEHRPADADALLAQVRAARAALTDADLDRTPPVTVPSADPDDPTRVVRAESGPEDPTSVVPLPLTGDSALNRTSRLPLPPTGTDGPDGPGADSGGGRLRGRRGPLAVIAVLLVLLGVGAGVWYVADGRFTTVPGVLSLTEAQARHRLSQAGLGSKVEQDFSLTVPRGNVIATRPGPGKRIGDNGTVTLTVSKGPQVVRVPDVTGRPLATAQQEIKAAGLVPGQVTRTFSDTVPAGKVISTSPAGATDRAPGTPVTLTVSRGAAVEVPDVIDESPDQAQQDLTDAGLKVVIAPDTVYSDQADSGNVARESPGGGAQAAAGDTVTITLSKGRQMFDVPDVGGKHTGEAKQILEDAGFKVRVITLFFGDTVFSQSPTGQAPQGATVTLWVR
ncbi:Stk1 family PASTA domain-containing Ser/Thr kinase [Actinacidiphila acididurans]|uniref:non-specific serine/threonine protein kinase n=1 Tax=Actinacidiphila acididurans TaxID=2784346 RepID=A0ABS2TTA0_9ACTN|nr:Stk1 family PASTA domain-containing Ser/Thr kinase [Actinacidiphila acididurans]MBM9505490.1 Stk1 family PASTA domain-containing Ser/Thr kinase [Actinacidiphila acididurans]